MASEHDIKLLEQLQEKKEKFLIELVESRIMYLEDTENDYFLFIYLATILNFVEAHNGGCLSEVGMMSLKVNISSVLDKFVSADTNNKVTQEELVRTSLNLLNSYAVCVLTKGMFEIAKENEEGFFKLNEFPIPVREDFDMLNNKVTDLMPKLKLFLDVYTPHLDKEHKKIFTQEKNNGFFKQIFNAEAVKTNGGLKGVENAIEMKA
jgi:hypothetical protein